MREIIKHKRRIPRGEMYSLVMRLMSYEQYLGVERLLVESGMVKMAGQELVWQAVATES